MKMHLMKKRIIYCMIIFILCFGMLFTRLGYVTFILANTINPLADELWSREIPVNSSRGIIYDRNGKVIVGNELALSVAVMPRQITDKEKTAKTLANILECDYKKILEYLNKNVSVQWIKPEGRRISYEKAVNIVNLNLDGVYIVSDSKRSYPYGTTLAQTLGFCGIDGDGLSGIEYYYNDYLKSGSGSLSIYTDAKGHIMNDMTSYYESATAGLDLYLTIDIELQTIMDNVINNAVAMYNPDQVMGLMMDVETGEILAMTSYPYFDPSDYQSYSDEVINRNLPIFFAFEPGSTFKVLTFAAGLEESKFNLNERFYDPGYRVVSGVRIKDWKAGGHGEETFLEVIQNSCNPGFMEIGERLGVETFYKYLQAFGYGEKTGIDLQGESKGILVNKKNAGPVELATMSFGQANAVTPLQLTTATIAAVNGGELLTPYILKNVKSYTNEVFYTGKKQVKRRVISEETSALMRYALECVVAKGTGRNAYVEGYRVGGKTGTAQKIGENGGYLSNNYILSFMGVAPMNNPKIACYLAVDNPKNVVQYGGVVTAPLVGQIMEQSLTYLGIERDYTNQISKEVRWGLDTKTYEVPNLIGQNKKSIKASHYYNYVYMGSGDLVVDQSPQAGEKVLEGGTIIVYLN